LFAIKKIRWQTSLHLMAHKSKSLKRIQGDTDENHDAFGFQGREPSFAGDVVVNNMHLLHRRNGW